MSASHSLLYDLDVLSSFTYRHGSYGLADYTVSISVAHAPSLGTFLKSTAEKARVKDGKILESFIGLKCKYIVVTHTMLKIHKQISQVFYSQANDGVWLEYGVIAIFDHFLWCPGGGEGA
jgi:hypothetical protein